MIPSFPHVKKVRSSLRIALFSASVAIIQIWLHENNFKSSVRTDYNFFFK